MDDDDDDDNSVVVCVGVIDARLEWDEVKMSKECEKKERMEWMMEDGTERDQIELSPELTRVRMVSNLPNSV